MDERKKSRKEGRRSSLFEWIVETRARTDHERSPVIVTERGCLYNNVLLSRNVTPLSPLFVLSHCMPRETVGMEPQVAPYTGLLQRSSNANNSNEARLKLLERRMTGELPSPRSLTFDGHLYQSSDDVTSARFTQLPQHNQISDIETVDLTDSAERAGKRRKFSPASDQQDQNHKPPNTEPLSPLRQVTNQSRRKSSPATKRDSHRKASPTLTSPLSSRLLQRNTISKYFASKGENSAETFPPATIGTQTHVSFQEQEQTLQNQLLVAFRTMEEAQ